MKISVAALSILLIMTFSSLTSSAPMASNTPTSCCFTYVQQQIQRKFVTHYYKTSNLCSQPAVVFQTKKGRQVCANPSEDWVQKYMDDPELK
ncbi:C-C motif chemokine 4-like [Dromiciops gliroides]|uniref:C-C motif chemokine 4-like n=1 Tax=Dromiciops gliroides TaxID=33562 RepID=UPI001CC6D693|nr:C-C motif chemokine 4-like [Dromiciops gliroides]